MKIFRKIHLWLSIPFGLIMTITCLSGAILVFENEITGLLNSRKTNKILYQQEANKALNQQGTAEAQQIEKKVSKKTYPFFRTTRHIHRWLLDKPAGKKISAGRTIVGISTLMMLFVLISGLIIWWPHSGKMLKNRLTVCCKYGSHRFWHDVHSSLGFYVCLVLIVMAVTGLSWSFKWWGNGMKSILAFLAPDNNPMKLIWLIHTGSWGGIFSKTIWFISALIGASLPLTGYYIWLKRLK